MDKILYEDQRYPIPNRGEMYMMFLRMRDLYDYNFRELKCHIRKCENQLLRLQDRIESIEIYLREKQS
jgi:hypothetical protein